MSATAIGQDWKYPDEKAAEAAGVPLFKRGKKLCFRCGRYNAMSARFCQHCEKDNPIQAHNPHELAKHQVRYSHRPWIAWRDEGGIGWAAVATASNLTIAIEQIGDRKISLYIDHHSGTMGDRKMAEIWRANARIGCLS